MLVGCPVDTLKKWTRARRSALKQVPLHGETGAYFGATFERTDTETHARKRQVEPRAGILAELKRHVASWPSVLPFAFRTK